MPAKFLLIVVGGAAVVALGGAVVISRRAAPPVPLAGSPNELAEKEALEKEVQRLRGQLEATVAANKAYQRQRAGAGASDQPAMTEEESEARSAARREAVYATIDAQLGTEAADAAWAPGASALLKDAVAKNAAFGALRSAQCASTLCKVVVTHGSTEDSRRFVEGFSGDPALEGQVVYRYDHTAGAATTTIWMSRKGHKLPSPPRADRPAKPSR